MDPDIFAKCHREASRDFPLGSEQALMDETHRRYAKTVNAVLQYESIEIGSSGQLQRYEFKPFKEVTEIRLLRFQRFVHFNSNPYLSYEILHVNLRDRPKYTALSYTWGPTDEAECHPIVINGNKCIMVTKPLVQLLFQHTKTDTLFWTDQLCINQYNLVERGVQVALMRHVYSEASSTVLWLGLQDEDSVKVSKLMTDLMPLLDTIDPRHTTRVLTEMLVSRRLENAPTDLPIPGLDDPCWKALHSFLHRPWFSRIWVFQEAILSKKPTFQCGGHTFNLKALLALTCLDTAGGPEIREATSPGALMCVELESYQDRVDQRSLPVFTHLLYDVGGLLKSRDPRDKIYGLLGTQEAAQMLSLPVDYTKPVVEVYRDTALELIHQSGNLHVLQYLKEESTEHNMPGLPSWVPNWGAPKILEPLHGSSHEIGKREKPKFNACRNSKHYSKTAETKNMLIVRGRIIDAVDLVFRHIFDVSETQLDSIDSLRWPLILSKYLQSSKCRSGTRGNYSPRFMNDKIIRTLTADGHGHFQIAFAEQKQWDEIWHRPLSEGELSRMWTTLEEMTQEDHGDFDSLVEKFKQLNIEKTLGDWMVHTGVCKNRRLALLKEHFLGLCPRNTLKGDVIAILHGLDVPIVLRWDPDALKTNIWGKPHPMYRVIGPCFVDGAMYGELMGAAVGGTENIALI